MTDMLSVRDKGCVISFTFDDIMKYHGPEFPGGVAHAFKVMERAFPLLDPEGAPERHEVKIETPFRGPGARDAFEMVLRANSEGRLTIDPAMLRTDRGRTLQYYVFRLSYRARTVELLIRNGHVRDAFIALSSRPDRTEAEEAELTSMKKEMADRLLALPAAEIYDPA